MEKYFCNYNQSLFLKELGFNKDCFGFYDDQCNNDKSLYINDYVNLNVRFIFTKAPLKSQAFEFFRDKFGMFIEIGYGLRIDFYFTIYKNSVSISEKNDYFTYEEAESACIDELIEISKQNK